MINTVPSNILNRKDKIGFATPENEWFRKRKFKDLILDILHSNKFESRKIIDPQLSIKLYQKHLDKKINISQDIWKWINLEFWFQKYL